MHQRSREADQPLPPDHPLWALDNVLLSPHSADKTADSHDRAVALYRSAEGWYVALSRLRRAHVQLDVGYP